MAQPPDVSLLQHAPSAIDPDKLAKLAAALRQEQSLDAVASTETARRLLDRTYPRQNPMDDVVMQARVQQLAGDDINVDPLIARYRPEHGGLNLKGFRVSPNMSDESLAHNKKANTYFNSDTGLTTTIPTERGTVNVLGAENNNPDTWAHEYRHAEVSSEYANRKLDAAYAATPKDWDSAVDFWIDQKWGGKGKKMTRQQAEDDLLKTLNEDPAEGSIAKPRGNTDPNPYWKQRFAQRERSMKLEELLADAQATEAAKKGSQP